ncbi:MAG: ATP-binding cassette domain-containing protein [Kiloniellales bacterium]|nr:ATP-binding cassette domain-containing protein [Kiloniellales bacterium]
MTRLGFEFEENFNPGEKILRAVPRQRGPLRAKDVSFYRIHLPFGIESFESNQMIRLTDVHKAFGENRVLKGVNLDVPDGARAVLIGTAASGTSVLMKCVNGLYDIDAGTIEVGGQDIAGLKGGERSEFFDQFGMLFQQGGLFDSLPVWENIAFKQVTRRELSREAARELAIEKLAMVGLAPQVADLYPVNLSGGMQKRAGIARAIAANPRYLLLDEPTAGLDPISTQAINRMIKAVTEELGATLLSITSDMEAARRHYDLIAMLHDGEIVWSGPSEESEASDNPYLLQLLHGSGLGPISMRVHARAS